MAGPVLSCIRIYLLVFLIADVAALNAQALYNEPFNSSLNTCTATNNSFGGWIWTNSCAYSNLGGHTAAGSAFFSGQGCKFGNGGSTVSGNLVTPTIAIGPGGAVLNFNYLRVGETIGFYDVLSLQLSNNASTFTTVLHTNGGGGLNGYASTTPTQNIVWHQACYNLSAYAGQTITVRFNFNSLDGILNDYDGIYVDDISISVPSPLMVSQSTNNVCPGTAVTLSTNAAAGFSWSTGAITPTIVVTPTVTTSYSVNSCSGGAGGTGTLVVNVTPQLFMNVSVPSSGTVACTASAVNLTATAAGGVPGYTYTWQGTTQGNVYAANQQAPGAYIYTVTVNDAHSCTLTRTASLTFIQSPSLTSIPGQTICPATQATLSTSGAHTYTWFPGAVPAPSLAVSPSVTTSYSVTGTNTLTGCTTTGTTVIVMKPTPTLAVVQASITCAALGFGTVTPSGGIGPFSFHWSPTNQTTAIANNLNTSTYTISVFDAGTACTTTTTTQFTPLTPLTAQLVADTVILCNSIPTGSAHFTSHANGSGSEFYSWTDGSSTLTVPSPTTLGAATWSVTMTDALTACKVYSVFTITQPPAVTLNVSAATPSVCLGGNIVLTGTASGGTPGYNYHWTGGPLTSTFMALENSAGPFVYTVTATDSNTCSATNTVSVDFVPNPLLSVADVSICPLETGNLLVSGATSYTWSNNTTGNSLAQSPPATTRYTVTGSALGCTSVATPSIIVKPLPLAIIQSNSPRCENAYLQLTGFGGPVFSWTGPAGFTSASASPLLGPLGLNNAGVYQLTVTAANGCTASTSANVVVNPTPSLSAAGATVCTIQSATLTAASVAGAAYHWNGPLGYQSFQQNPVLSHPSIPASGQYTVKATSPQLCVATATVHLSVVPPPSLTAQLSSHSLCSQAFNGSPNTITLTAGGASSYTLLTLPDMHNANPAGPVSPLTVIPPNTGVASATLYGTNGVCTVSTGVTFSIIPNPTVSMNSYTPEICAGQSFTYTNSGATSYTWNNTTPNFTTYNNGGVAVAHPSISSVFSVYGGSLGCNSASQTTTITVHPIPTLSVTSGENRICLGTSTVLSVAGTAEDITWIPINGLSGTMGNSVIAFPVANQVYTVIGTANHCTNSAVASVTVLPLPSPAALLSDTLVCEGETVTMTGSGGQHYQWTGPQFSLEGKVISFEAGTQHSGWYVLSVKDGNGCRQSTGIGLQVMPLPGGNLTGKRMQGCVPFCGDFVYENPGAADSTITASWISGGRTFSGRSFSLCIEKPGEQSVIGRFFDKATGCSNTRTFVVTGFPVPEADFYWLPAQPVEGLEEVLFLNASEGERQEKFSWHFIDNNGYRSEHENTSYFFSNAGTYPVALVVENSYGCADTALKHVAIEAGFTFFVPNSFTPNGDGINDVFIPVASGIKQYDLTLFNRWGDLLFKTSDISVGWNGEAGSEPCAQGVYVWKASVSTIHGESKTITGHLTLLR